MPRQPHIIVLMADDLGMSDLGYTGSSFVRTPTLDTLARHAVHLANFFAPTWCAPARSALLTGRLPWEVGVTAALSAFFSLERAHHAHTLWVAGRRGGWSG